MSNLLKQALTALEKAREAVEDWSKYASEYFQSKHGIDADLASIDTEIAALRTAIEQAEQAQPVGVLQEGGRMHGRTYTCLWSDMPAGTPLYTHPQPSKPLSEAPLGAAVLVDGKTVAWFAEFTESANEWCTENYFGQWLAWRAMPPEIVPLTSEELTAVEQRAAELREFLNIKEQS